MLNKITISLHIILFLLPSLFCSVLNSYSQNPNIKTSKLTIYQAVEFASKNNPVLKNAQLSIEAAKSTKLGIINFPSTEFTYRQGQMYSANIDHSFEINQNFGSVLTHLQNSKFTDHQINLSEIDYRIVEKEIIAQTKIAFYKWIYLINQFKIKQEQAGLYKEFVRIAQLKYELGESNLLEQTLVETEYAASKNNLLKITEELIIAENKMKQIMNIDGDFIPKPDTLLIYQLPAGTDPNNRFSSTVLLDYYENLYNTENIKYNIERSKYFPEISAGYFNQQINNTNGFSGWNIGVRFPLWFLPQKASIHHAKINKEKALNTFEYQKFNLEKEIENLVIHLDQLQNDLIYYHENALKKADLLILTAGNQFEKEEIEYFEFLQSITTAQNIKLEYLNSLFRYNETAIKLEFYTK